EPRAQKDIIMQRFATLLGVISFLSVHGSPGTAAEPHAKGGARVQASIQKREFGKTADGTGVDLYVLTNAQGVLVKVTTYGAIVTELHVPDRAGRHGNVVLGFDNLQGYLAGHPYFGAICGRVANRIAGAKFTLDGKQYTLAANNGPNSLHG